MTKNQLIWSFINHEARLGSLNDLLKPGLRSWRQRRRHGTGHRWRIFGVWGWLIEGKRLIHWWFMAVNLMMNWWLMTVKLMIHSRLVDGFWWLLLVIDVSWWSMMLDQWLKMVIEGRGRTVHCYDWLFYASLVIHWCLMVNWWFSGGNGSVMVIWFVNHDGYIFDW